MNRYKDKPRQTTQKMKGPKEGQETLQTKARDQQTAAALSKRQDRGPHKDIKEKNIQKK